MLIPCFSFLHTLGVLLSHDVLLHILLLPIMLGNISLRPCNEGLALLLESRFGCEQERAEMGKHSAVLLASEAANLLRGGLVNRLVLIGPPQAPPLGGVVDLVSSTP